MRIFILEDEAHRYPRNEIVKVLKHHKITLCVNSYDARADYRPDVYDLLLLDHDMRGCYDDPGFHDTGFQFVKHLVELKHKVKPDVILHSQNDKGRRAMKELLLEHKFHVRDFYFGPDYLKYLKETF